MVRRNWFVENPIEILVENNHRFIENIAEENYFGMKDHRLDEENRNK